MNHSVQKFLTMPSLAQLPALRCSSAAHKLLLNFVDLSFCQQVVSPEDHVHAYACEVLSLGLMLMEFNDAVREGDGTRIICCWRYFLLLFKANRHANYAVEAFNLLVQFDFLLPHRLARQLVWSRTINSQGRPGKNISCDLHMEHLNREVKNQIAGLGSNVTNDSITRIGNTLGEMLPILQQFDCVTGINLHLVDIPNDHVRKIWQLLLNNLKKHQVFSVLCQDVPIAHFVASNLTV